VGAEAYVAGPAEDWIEGALSLNGKDQYCVVAHAEMTADYSYEGGDSQRQLKGSYPGAERRTLDMADNNFLIEILFRTAPNYANGVLVSKRSGSGYELGIDAQGAAVLTLSSGEASVSCVGPAVNDGAWHHLIAEVDRPAGSATIYLDGKKAAEGALRGIAADASLANSGDFFVGRSVEGGFFEGAIDFLRVSRGTLADAETDIAELYEWEFNGPFLRDFTGKEPVGRRDAGALEVAR
jgi:hypothetical protein